MVDVAELLRAQEREKRDRAAEVRKRRAAEVDEKEKGAGLVWILYMRFARRSEVRRLPPPSPRLALSFSRPLVPRTDELRAMARRRGTLGHQGRPGRLCKGAQVPARDLAGVRGVRSVSSLPSSLRSHTRADTESPPCLPPPPSHQR